MLRLSLNTAVLVVTLIGLDARAENTLASRPTVIISSSVEINRETITLGDIAQIGSNRMADTDLVERLRTLSLGMAPAPGGSRSLSGDSILELMRNNQINPQEIGYSIPHVVTISRAGRLVTMEELLSAIRTALPTTENEEIRLQQIIISEPVHVPFGKTLYKVQPLGMPARGKWPLRLEAITDGSFTTRFLATAEVDYWRTVAVAKRPLDRGMLISPDDVDLVKLNLSDESEDFVFSVQEAVGKKSKQRFAAGTPLRKTQIDFPPSVHRGAKVAIKYRDGILEASAEGIAVNDGRDGEVISVQNEASKRIIRARIISPEVVEVISQ